MRASEILSSISTGGHDTALDALYGAKKREIQRARWKNAAEKFIEKYGDREAMMFSVPGRSEICGNHTDHNRGAVIAAAVDLDVIGLAAKNDGNTVRVFSDGYGDIITSLDDTDAKSMKKGTPHSLIAGMCDAFARGKVKCGGFDVWCTSDVLKGSGLSSSAAFEVFIGSVINHLFNSGTTDAVNVAKYAQHAENVFFGKPCGLMDQTACSVGGFVFIDFEDPDHVVVKKLECPLSEFGYVLCITDTGGNHADLTDDYAAIPSEMKAVAKALGCDVLRRTDKETFMTNIPRLRRECGDRAVLRALHFFTENERVYDAAQAIEAHNINRFLTDIKASGDSSFKYLQNIYSNKNVKEQGLALALALSESIVCRVHGGGFAGTIQAFVKTQELEDYKKRLESVFGEGSCRCLTVRTEGAVRAI
ncbi:MAG TPA: galactokinase family protein [Bacillota bacterium]|nr:galactokinase family protein [Bacillota bacterium]